MDKEFLGTKLARPVNVCRVDRFVGAESNHSRNFTVDRRVNNVLRPEDVCLDCFKRVVLTRRNLLQCRRMNYHVYIGLKRPVKPVTISNVPDEERQP